MSGCEVCGREDRTLVVDHDHATGLIRGHVCKRCNLALAVIEDEPLMVAAHAYLLLERPDAAEYRTVQLAKMKERYATDPVYREATKARAVKWNRDSNYKHQRAHKQRLKAVGD
jgi:Recombination endonuclease VII